MPRKPRSAPPPHKFRTWLKCLELERRDVPSRPLPYPVIYVGAETGAPPAVKVYDAETGKLNFERTAYESTFTGGVRVATADFTGDGFPDLAVAPGEGGGPRVRILDGKTGKQIDGPLGNFFAFSPAFTGGVEVAAGDVTGDNVPDLIVAAGKTGGPHVRVFDGQSGNAIMNFMAFDPDFRGGVSIAAADFTRDGKADLVVGAGFGGGPHVKIFDVASGQTIAGPLGNFFAYESSFTGGVRVGTDWKTGDFSGDAFADLAVAPGPGRAPEVKVYSGTSGKVLREFVAFDATMTVGVRVGLSYVTDDIFADVVVATGVGVPNEVRVYDGQKNVQLAAPLGTYTPFGPTNTNGLTLATSNDPPNQYGFYDLPVDETFPDGKVNQGTMNINTIAVNTKVEVSSSDSSRLRWDLTVTNTSQYTEIPHQMAEDGMSYFRMPTNVVSGVVVFPSASNWWGNVVSTGGEQGIIEWVGDPIIPGHSIALSFETPALNPIFGTVVAAAYPPTGGGFLYEAVTTQGGVVPGPKVEIQITRVENDSIVSATELFVAKWNDAFDVNAGNVVLKGPNPADTPNGKDNSDFIDRDNDRFNVWVKNVTKWSAKNADQTPAFPYIDDVKISTSNTFLLTDYDDKASSISLTRYTGGGKEAGWYWSDSQMLVSNEVDDKYNTNTSSYLAADEAALGGLGLPKIGAQYRWKVSDRTHRIALGGKVKAEYEIAAGNKIKVESPVLIKKNIQLNVYILRATTGGDPTATGARVTSDIQKVREIYAQVGIALPPALISVIDPPALPAPAIDLSNGLSFSEMLSLFRNAALHNPPDANGKKNITVFYVNFYVPDNRAGFSLTHKTLTLENMAATTSDDAFVASNLNIYMVLAHEVAHLLENLDDSTPGHPSVHHPYLAAGVTPTDPLDKVNLLVDGPRAISAGDIFDSRRLTVAQQDKMRNGRPAYLIDP